MTLISYTSHEQSFVQDSQMGHTALVIFICLVIVLPSVDGGNVIEEIDKCAQTVIRCMQKKAAPPVYKRLCVFKFFKCEQRLTSDRLDWNNLKSMYLSYFKTRPSY
ncbi:hypothetical protein ScPMuIL_013753 [Solemya velum]